MFFLLEGLNHVLALGAFRGSKPELLEALQRLGEGDVRAHSGDLLSSYRCRRTRFCCPFRVSPIMNESCMWAVASTGSSC
jgi:hypothetical protein